MRNPNKFYRNKEAKEKARRRAFSINGGQFNYKSCMPYTVGWKDQYRDHNFQLKNYINTIEDFWMRTFLNGNQRGSFHAPKFYRKIVERAERRTINNHVRKYTYMDIDDVENSNLPFYKHDADWDWF